jgi:CubicO group peptidase (beta-lactamase class C family)
LHGSSNERQKIPGFQYGEPLWLPTIEGERMKSNLIARRDFLRLGAVSLAGMALPPLFAQPQKRARFDWKLYQPEEVGMSAAGLAGIRAALQKQITDNNLFGAVVAVARHNKLVCYEAFGVSDVEANTPMQKDSIFRMMSATKPVTAVAILMMIEAGKLNLDDKVSRFIPSFANPKVAVAPQGWQKVYADPSQREQIAAQIKLVPAEREITIKDLLTHTAGFSTLGPSSLLGPVTPPPPPPGETLVARAARLGAMPLDFQPGDHFAYSPLDGFDVLLAIVQITSGRPADQFVQERILHPLDMHDTYYSLPTDKESRVVKVYERKADAWAPVTPYFGFGPAMYISGAGGLFSTARDFMQFQEMRLNQGELNGKRLLKADSIALMRTNQIGELYIHAVPQFPAMTAGQGFGLGVAVTLDTKAADSGRGAGSSGWPGAYGTDSWADPELDLTAAIFMQQPSILITREADLSFSRAIRAAVVS